MHKNGSLKSDNKLKLVQPDAEIEPDEPGESRLASGRATVRLVERTFDVLEALAQEQRPVPISELSTRLGLHVSTVHRLLGTFIERGYARQDEQSGRYYLGNRLLELVSNLPEKSDLRAEAHPLMEELADQLAETVNLSVRNGDLLVYIDQVQTNRLVRMFTRVGSSAPLYCTASGKLFLAFGPTLENFERELNRYLLANRLEPRTSGTLVKPPALREELRLIRERGYSFDNEEMEEGVVCVAAPIFDGQHQIVAALSVSGPTSRMLNKDISRILDPLRASARTISQAASYQI